MVRGEQMASRYGDTEKVYTACAYQNGTYALFAVNTELLDQAVGHGLVPVRAEQLPRIQVFLHRDLGSLSGGVEFPGKAEFTQGAGVFPHRFAAVGHLARIHGVLPRQDAEQRRLACTVAADQAVNAARFNGKVEIKQHLLLAVTFAKALGPQYAALRRIGSFHHFSPSS